MQNNQILYRITLPYAVFGLLVQNGRVVKVAPIAAWTKGKEINKVASYYVGKGGKVESR